MASGDPRKQPRPDGRPEQEVATDQVVEAFPPAFSGVVTDVEAQLVQFPGFQGGQAINLVLGFGPLKVNAHFPPQTAEAIIDVIRQVKMHADTDVVPATMDTLKQMTANGNGEKG